MGEVEISAGWISFTGDRCCLDSVRGRENRVSGYWGRVMKKKKKKKNEKRGFMGRERIHASMVLKQWVRYGSHKK